MEALADAATRGVHVPQALAPRRMIFGETALDGAWVIEPERIEDERGFFARTWDADEFARARADAGSPSAASRTTARAGRSAGCTTRRRRTRRRSSFAARPARSSTSPSTSGPTRPPSELVRRRALGGEPARALRARGLRARLPDARGRPEVLYQISEAYVPDAGRGRALDDPAFGIAWPGEVVVINERDRTYPDFERRARVTQLAAVARGAAIDARLRGRAVPDLPQHHRRRRPGDARGGRAADPARGPRGAERHAGPRLDGSRRVEHPRRLRRATGRRARRRLPRVEPPRRQLQRAGPAPMMRSTSCGPTCTRSPSNPTGSRTGPRTTRGRGASASRRRRLDALADGRVRGRDRQHARAGLADVRRVLPAGRTRRRGAAHDPRLPPVARERQPLRDRAADRARRARSPSARGASRTASCSSPARSARSRGSRGTRRGWPRSSAGSSSPASATAAAHLQAQPARRSRRSTARRRTCSSRRTAARVVDFVPWGWDERQFNSPGFDLPVGCLSRSREGEYAEYHSSADDLELVRPEQLADALARRARDPRRPRDGPALREPRSRRASRSSASAASTRRSGGAAAERSSWRCSGC